MSFKVKTILGKTGIEVTYRIKDRIVGAHFYEKQQLDNEVKQYLIKLVEKSYLNVSTKSLSSKLG